MRQKRELIVILDGERKIFHNVKEISINQGQEIHTIDWSKVQDLETRISMDELNLLVRKLVKDWSEWRASENMPPVHFRLSTKAKRWKYRIDSETCVEAFIDRHGNILKPNGYSTPHPTPRGNLFDDDMGYSHIGIYGPNYINHFSDCTKGYLSDFMDRKVAEADKKRLEIDVIVDERLPSNFMAMTNGKEVVGTFFDTDEEDKNKND